MPITKKKLMPEFQSEEEERQFWGKHDSTQFMDWRTAKRHKCLNLKPTLRTISMINHLKVLANKRDVPYQALLKVFLADRLKRERRRVS